MENNMANHFSEEQLEQMVLDSDSAKAFEMATRLYKGDGVEKDVPKAIDLFRKTAANGFIPAMYAMTYICHNDREGFDTQNRTEELFWYNQTFRYLKGDEFLYHSQNMIEGSYDKRFALVECNRMLELAAALGDERSKWYLAHFYAKQGDKESLEKSLYWFYRLERITQKQKQELELVESELGLIK